MNRSPRLTRWILGALLLASAPTAVHAQLADRKVLTLSAAKLLLDAAEAEAGRNGWKVSIAVVDDHGELLAFRRMDGAVVASVDIARGKASTAARLGRPTKALGDAVSGGATGLLSVEGLVLLQGGLPIIVDGVVVGGIGASGATGAQDEQVAAAGMAALRP